jgi:hypothetical protein
MVTTFFALELMGVLEWYASRLWNSNAIRRLLDGLSPLLEIVFDFLDFFLERGGRLRQLGSLFRILRAGEIYLTP